MRKIIIIYISISLIIMPLFVNILYAKEITGYILKIEGRRVYIDLGEQDGVKVGDVIDVVCATCSKDKIIAQIEIAEVYEDNSMGILLGEKYITDINQFLNNRVRAEIANIDKIKEKSSALKTKPLIIYKSPEQTNFWKWTSLGVGVSLMGMGWYFKNEADNSYDEYLRIYKEASASWEEYQGLMPDSLKSNYLSSLDDARRKTQNNDLLSTISLATGGVALTLSLYFFLKPSDIDKETSSASDFHLQIGFDEVKLVYSF